MFTRTSTVTKVAIFALSAGLTWSAFAAFTLSFQARQQTVQVIELPQVVVIGYRASVSPDTAQANAQLTGRSPI